MGTKYWTLTERRSWRRAIDDADEIAPDRDEMRRILATVDALEQELQKYNTPSIRHLLAALDKD